MSGSWYVQSPNGRKWVLVHLPDVNPDRDWLAIPAEGSGSLNFSVSRDGTWFTVEEAATNIDLLPSHSCRVLWDAILTCSANNPT